MYVYVQTDYSNTNKSEYEEGAAQGSASGEVKDWSCFACTVYLIYHITDADHNTSALTFSDTVTDYNTSLRFRIPIPIPIPYKFHKNTDTNTDTHPWLYGFMV